PRTPHRGSLLYSIWEAVRGQVQPAPTAPLQDAPAPADSDLPGLRHSLRLAPDWQAPEPPEVDSLHAYRGREFGDQDNRPEVENPAARLARHTGSVLHSQLQHLAEQPPGGDFDTWARQRRPFWALQLRQLGWEAGDTEAALEKIHRGLQQTLEDPDGRWLLHPGHEDSHCELALQHWHQQALCESVIDRTFVCDGVRWIVDYKSSQPEDGQSTADFVAREVASYRPQLARYARVMTELGE